jgi:transposase-like protein
VGCLAKRFSSSQDQNERFGSRVAKTTFKVFGDMSNVGKTLRATTRFWTLSTTVFEVMRLPLLARVDSALT